ncbi:hypothetical protein C0993_007229 [Termitomyces sp. T159_Od127]|nr:hypothetical protein C0993_007229 [Termitomyces sp. T159_Od127]
MLPDLPPEIQDEIFDYAARIDPKYAPTLSVISKRVQSRVEKVIYEKLHFFPVRWYLPWPRSAEVATIELFKPTLAHRPAEFFATHVRSVIFQYNVQYCSGRLVLEKCTGLEHLAFLRRRPFDVPDASPLILPSAYTLQSLITNRDILNYMANSGIVLPK